MILIITIHLHILNTSGVPFTISGNQLLTNAALDYETQTSYTISISSNDGINTILQSFTINVNDINDTTTSDSSTQTTPTTWYVSSGQTSSPYYLFYDNPDGTSPTTTITLDSDLTYTFARLNTATTHPFYVSDVGRNLLSSSDITITGDGSYNNGISGSQTFTLSFNLSFATPNTINWYCTVHSSMVGTFNVI